VSPNGKHPSLSSIGETNEKQTTYLHTNAMTRDELRIWASRETYSIYAGRSTC